MADEMRLIDVKDAEKFAREHILDAKERYLILDFLRECSTVDAVEVVRCKECKHYSGYGYQKCRLHSTEPDQYGPGADVCMEPDDFCSCGERRANG